MGYIPPKMTLIPDWTLNYQRWEILRIRPWYIGERWVVLEYEKYYREPSKKYRFLTEAEANEFVMLKMLERQYDMSPDPFWNYKIQYDIQKCPPKFNWIKLCWNDDQWEVTEGMIHTRVKGNKYYKFDSEKKANEFVMLKKLEQ